MAVGGRERLLEHLKRYGKSGAREALRIIMCKTSGTVARIRWEAVARDDGIHGAVRADRCAAAIQLGHVFGDVDGRANRLAENACVGAAANELKRIASREVPVFQARGRCGGRSVRR